MTLLRRPLALAVLIGLAAEALFLFHLAVPHKLMFDETHYVPAARALLSLAEPTNKEHPLLGKELIAAGIALFGDNSFGWRFLSTLAGTAVVLGIYAIAWLATRQVRTAGLAAVLAISNFTVLIQARIAMLDGFMAAFLVLGIAMVAWTMRTGGWGRWLAAAVLMGLAIGVKWTAVPYVAFAGLTFLIVRARDARLVGRPWSTMLSGRDQAYWPGLPAIPALLAFGVVAIIAYFLTFLPAFFYATDPMTLGRLLPFQGEMYALQTQVLASHPYQSSWWSWPLDIRPIWYLYEQTDGAQRGVLMVGNPVIWWGGLVAVLACLWGWVRGGPFRLLAGASLWVGSLAIWAIIPKSLGFFYYYYLSSIFLPLVIAFAFADVGRGRWRSWDEGFLAAALGVFCYFYPILAAMPLTGPGSFHTWMLLPSWP